MEKILWSLNLRTGVEKSRNLMTVRIAQNIGISKIANFASDLNIYDNPDELSVSVFRI